MSPQPARLSRLLSLLGPFLGLAFVLSTFYLLTLTIPAEDRPRFIAAGNFRIVANQTVIVALGALGMTVVIISGGIDLSVGSVIALGSVVMAVAIRDGKSPYAALAAAIAIGGLIGAANGTLITKLRMTPFIVTLGMLGIVRGAAKWIAKEQSVNAAESWVNGISSQNAWLGVSPGVWIALALALLLSLVLQRSSFGRHVFAIGSNEAGTQLSGVRVGAVKVAVYGIAGLFFGLAGVVQYARLNSQGDPSIAAGAELDCIAAVVIGGGSLSGGEGSILGSLVGALIMAFLRNGSQQMGWPGYVQEIIIGAVIVVAVALDRLRHR